MTRLFLALALSGFLLAAAEGESDVSSPHPLTLKPSWYEYFNADTPVFEERATTFKQSLAATVNELEGEQKEQATALVKKISISLDTLAKTRGEEISEPLPKAFSSEYSLAQQIEVAKQLDLQRKALQGEKKEIGLLSKRIGTLASHLDKLLVTYREQQDNTTPKLLTGLEMIDTRLSLDASKEKLRLSEGRREAFEGQIKRSEDELKFARENRNYTLTDPSALEGEIQKAKKEVESAKSRSLRIELRASEVFDESPQGRIRSSAQQLVELNYGIKELSAEVSLLSAQMQSAISQVAQGNEGPSPEEINHWQTALTSAANHAKEWNAKNQEELDRFEMLTDEQGEVDRATQNLQSQRIKLVQENRAELAQLEGKLFTTKFVFSQLDDLFKSQKSPLGRAWSTSIDYVRGCCGGVIEWYSRPLFKIGDTPITLMNIFKALLVFFFAYVLSTWIRKLISRGFAQRGTISKGFAYSINRLVHYVILFLGTILALTTLGLDFDRIYLVLGALSVGIGFGLQAIVNNFMSGLIILFSRNLAVGDSIELANGGWGSVLAINVMNTVIRTWDGEEIIVPNSKLVTEQYTNSTRRDPYKRVHIPFSVACGSDKDKVEAAALKAAAKVPATVGAAQGLKDPQCWLVGFEESGLSFELVVWTHVFRSGNHGSVTASYFWELDNELHEAGITLPYPIRDVRITKE